MDLIRSWFKSTFSNPQVVSLLLLFVGLWALVTFFGSIFAPVFAALVIAYLLEGPVWVMERQGLHRRWASTVVWAVFVLLLFIAIITLVPLLSKQVTQIFVEIPQVATRLQSWILSLPAAYPSLFTQAQAEDLVSHLSFDLSDLREVLVSRTRVLGLGVTYMVIYLVLVPLMVFFMLKDKDLIRNWARGFLPEDIGLISRVWGNVDKQLANYVRGKVVEILLIWVVTYLTFSFLDLRFAMLLSVITGLSVLVPYVGATLVTLPVAAVAYAQWGISGEMGSVLLAYGVIQALDGNLLVPLLFSEAVDLHPVAIIVAVLFFGGVWGFWGVFFSIPLATVVSAVISAWPKARIDGAAAEAAAIPPS